MTDTLPMNYPYTHRYGTDLDTLILSNQMASGHQQIGDKVHTASIAGIKETSQSARDVVDAVRDSIDASNQIGNLNLQSTERNGGEVRSSVERTAGQTMQGINAASNQIARDFAGVHRDICQTRQELATGFGNSDLRTSEGFGHTNLEMSKQHCEIKLEMCKQHAELARQIEARAAEAAEALCKCCHELQAEHATTRQLIQTQALDDCRRREATLQNDLNLLKFAQMSNGPGNN
jgi:hypothetical protein